MDYSKTAPTLSKYVDEATITEDVGYKVEKVEAKATSMTETKVTNAYNYIKFIGVGKFSSDDAEYAGKSYKEIADAVELSVDQVKQLEAEYNAVKVELSSSDEE